MLFQLTTLACLVSSSWSSQYNPHKYPGSTWFEGWYTRITLSPSSLYSSVGGIVGHYPSQNFPSAASAYAALLLQPASSSALKEYHFYPTSSLQLSPSDVTQSNPDDQSAPDFQLSTSLGNNNEFKISANGNFSSMLIRTSDYRLEVSISNPLDSAWGPNGEGPEGWVSHLPVIGLSWFVYALSAPAVVSLKQESTGKVLLDKIAGLAHMEKNWGTSFPRGWIWLEGMQISKGKSAVTLALAGGYASVAGIEVPNQFLVGYRSNGLKWNFHPQDPSVHSIEVNDACTGKLVIHSRSLGKHLKVEVYASVDSFSVVSGPTKNRFKSDSVESYSAVVTVSAFNVNPLLPLSDGTLIEKITLIDAAVEFGGEFQCSR